MKFKLSQNKKAEIIKQYNESFSLIAKDFVPECVEVDMYRLQDEWFGAFSKYMTVGVTADARFDSEFYLMVDGLLDTEKEKIIISEISNMILKLYNNEIACSSSTVVKVSDEAKKAFGFDYYLFDFHDFGISYEDKPIYYIQPVQIYENEYNFIQQNNHNVFLDLYEAKVPEDAQFLFGASREPLNL